MDTGSDAPPVCPVNERSPRVFVCDPQPATLIGIANVLRRAGVTVVGTATDPAACLAGPDTAGPLLYIADQSPIEAYDAALIKGLIETDRTRRVVAYSSYEHPAMIANAYQSGASAFVSKLAPLQLFLEAILTVHKHDCPRARHYPDGLAESLAEFFTGGGRAASSPRRLLTRRQFQIYLLLAKGLSQLDASERLNLHPRTVANHCVMIRRRIGIPTARFRSHAIEHGLIDPLRLATLERESPHDA